MKKVFQVLAVFLLLAAFSTPSFASVYSSSNVVTVDDEPSRKEEAKSDATSKESKEADKKGECTKSAKEKAACTKDKTACTKDKPACDKK